jgi:MtrB/PioB family decaheme-associated outer membrane protein
MLTRKGALCSIGFLLALAVRVLAQEGSLEAAVQDRNLNSASSRFEQYQDHPDGFVFERLTFSLDKKVYLDLKGFDLGLDDQEAALQFGQRGSWKVAAGWNQTPRRYTYQGQTIFGTAGDGFFTISDPVRAYAETATQAQATSLFNSLYAGTPGKRAQTRRDQGTLAFAYTSLPGFTFQADLRREKRHGDFPVANGFYRRYNGPNGDLFENIGVELPAPIAFTTTDVNVSAAYDHKWFGVRLGFSDSKFRNDVNALAWENPYRVSDGSGMAMAANGFLDFYPDNDAHSWSFQWNVNLPFWETRLTGSQIWGRMEQNQRLLPFSVNTALVDTATGLHATDPALLPFPAYNGDVRTRAQSYQVTTSPIPQLTFRGRYEAYNYMNHSPYVQMPGTTTYGDSYWVTNWGGLPIENHPNAFSRKRPSVDMTWRIVKGYRFSAGWARETWDRTFRQVAETNETQRWLTFAMEPVEWFGMKVSTTWDEHRIGYPGYDGGHHEYIKFRMFDVANRDTRVWSVETDFTPSSGWDIALYTHQVKNDYIQSEYGLQYNRGYDLGATVSWTKGSWTVFGSLSRDRNCSNLKSIAKSDLNGSGGANELNSWFSYLRDTVDVASVVFVSTLVPKKAALEFNYTYQVGRGVRHDSNGTGILVDNALAHPFPDTVNHDHLLQVKLDYSFTPQWAMGLKVTYDSFGLNDYGWDAYRAYNPNLGPNTLYRQFLMNAKYGSYDGLVAALFASYKF